MKPTSTHGAPRAATNRFAGCVSRAAVCVLLGAGHLAYGAPASKPGSWVSPEGSQVAFLRTNEQATDTGLNAPQGGRPQIDLWISNLDGSNSRPLVAGVGTQAPETNLTDIDAVAFSPDGKTLYFDTAAWLTSPAVHSVDIASGKQHLVTNGWLNHVVRAGRYKGDLVVMQHRHFVGSGTYNWYWLFSPDGKELGPIGPTEADPWDVRNLKDFEENDEH